MKAIIRPALSGDSAAIAGLATTSFGHAYDPGHIRQVLQSGRNYTLVADCAGTVCGFADCFLTRSSGGQLRLEFDLLAVAASARGVGLGASLVRVCNRMAQSLRVYQARALVRIENAAMQALMTRCGYKQCPRRFGLYVCDDITATGKASAIPVDNLVSVNTLGYRGIWIEGHLTVEMIQAAMARAQANDAHTIGALINETDSPARELLIDNGFSKVGDYQWWTFTPGSDPS